MNIIRRLRGLAQQLPADVNIGKYGLSERVIAEIKRRLKQKGIIKIRLLNSSLEVEDTDRRTMALEIARRVGGLLVDVRGKTLVIIRKDADPVKLLQYLESKVLKV